MRSACGASGGRGVFRLGRSASLNMTIVKGCCFEVPTNAKDAWVAPDFLTSSKYNSRLG